MSRNASGTYTLPSGNPVVTGTLIESSWANTTLSDLASAMTDSLSRSAQGGMTAALRLYDGTSSVPGLAWGSETTTGWYRSGAGDMRLVVTGSEVVKYLSTGVAVTGTLSATGAVSLSGTTMTLENSTAYYPQVINRNKTADANGSYISLQKIRGSSIVQNGDVLGNVIFSGYDGAAYLQGAYINAVVSATPGTNDMPADLAFGTTADGGSGPTERLRITQAGNVGVGTSSPDSKLAVYNATGTSQFRFGASSSYYWDISRDNDVTGNLLFSNNNATSRTTRMVIDSSGNVGIGTSSPSRKFEVHGAPSSVGGSGSGVLASFVNNSTAFNASPTAAVSLWNRINSGGSTFPSAVIQAGKENATDGNYAGYLSLQTTDSAGVSTERMRIDSSGNLLVGTTSTSGRLSVVGNAGGTCASFNANSNTVTPVGIIVGGNDTTQAALYVYSNGNGAFNAYIYSNGNLQNRNNSYGGISDVKLKENITEATPKLEKLQQVRVVNYNIKGDTQKQIGVIAQELEQVFPGMVEETPDRDQEGNDLGTTTKAVKYSVFVPMLIKAIQEQQAIIDAQQAALTALTARVTALETN